MTDRRSTKRIINRKYRHYSRWYEMHKRCHDPLNAHYKDYGGLGIQVDWEWHPDNPDGLASFNHWLETQMHAHPELSKARVTRRDKKANFNSTNCFVASGAEIGQNKVGVVLSVELVAAMRRFKKDNPDFTVPAIAKHFNIPSRNINLALIGRNWTNVNAIEAPVPNCALPEWMTLKKSPGAVKNEGIPA